MRNAIRILCAVLGGTSFAFSASAEPENDVWSDRVAVMGQLGFGTPTGYYGVTLDYAPIPLLVASAGIGVGSGPYCLAPDSQPKSYDAICSHWYKDLQYAAGGRVRVLRLDHTALALGAGLSMGGYTWVEFTTDEPAYKSTERAYWANLEVSSEYRADSGFSVRAFVGSATMLNPSSLECVSWGAGSGSSSHCLADHAGDGHRLIYLGVDLGWAF